MAMQHKQEDGTKLVVHRLVSRRKLKKSYEYEVEWQNTSPDRNTWIPRDKCAPSPALVCPNQLPACLLDALVFHYT